MSTVSFILSELRWLTFFLFFFLVSSMEQYKPDSAYKDPFPDTLKCIEHEFKGCRKQLLLTSLSYENHPSMSLVTEH